MKILPVAEQAISTVILSFDVFNPFLDSFLRTMDLFGSER